MKFAVIMPAAIPDPERRVTCAVEPLLRGCRCPKPSLGDSVTLSPPSFACIMKIFAPFIELPCPIPIHDMLEGPVTWMNISPEPLDDASGMLTA